MPLLERIYDTELFTTPPIDIGKIRYICQPIDAVSDTVHLNNIWPRARLLLFRQPFVQPGESEVDALFRASRLLSNTDNELRVGIVHDWKTSKVDWMKVGDDTLVKETFKCDIDGQRYSLQMSSNCTSEVYKEHLVFSAGNQKSPGFFVSNPPPGSTADVSGTKVVGDVRLDLSADGGILKFDVALSQKRVSEFGLEMRISEIVIGGIGSRKRIRSQAYIPLYGDEPRLSDGSSSDEKVLPLEVYVDPLEPLIPSRSFLKLRSGTHIAANLTASDGGSVLLVAVKHKVPVWKDEREQVRTPRFYFNTQSLTLDSDTEKPIQNWQSMELDGAFELYEGTGAARAATNGPRELLTGLSDTETLRLSTGQRLVFRRGGPAFLPSRDPIVSGGSALATASPSTPPTLQNDLTMSWVGVESENGEAATRIISEGSNNRLLALNESASVPNDASSDPSAIRLMHRPLELEPNTKTDRILTRVNASPNSLAHMLPILPFAGRPVGSGAPNVKEVELERRVIQPMRRRLLGPPSKPVGLMRESNEEIRTTPSGLCVAVKDGLITKLFLTRSVSEKDPVLYIRNVPRSLANALMRDQLFLVLNTLEPELGELKPELVGEIKIGDWPLRIRIEPVVPVALGTDSDTKAPFLIIKDDERPLKELIEDEDLWAGYTVSDGSNPFVNDIAATKEVLRAHFTDLIENRRPKASKEAKPAYDRAAAIWDHTYAKPGDKGWRGVLMTNAELKLSDLPDQLAALAAGLSGKKIHADYLGIDLNRVEQSDGKLDFRVSPVFGLVDYHNEKANEEVKEGDNFFNMELERLIVRFENGSVHNFYAKLLLLMRNLFDQPVREGDGGKQGRVLEIEGSRESRVSDGEKLDIYTFQNRQEWNHKFKGDGSLIKEIFMSRVAYSTTKTQLVDGGKIVFSSFSITGSILFANDFPPKLPLFDLDALKFKDLNIDLESLIHSAGADLLSAAFSPSNFSLDFKGSKKKGGLFSKLPFKPVGFEWWQDGATLDSLGFFGFGLDPGGSDLLAPTFKFGLRFDLDLGSLGNLGKKLKDFKLTALLGWRQMEGETGPLDKSQFSLGFKLEGNGGDGLDIGIGNVLRISADRYDFRKNGSGVDENYFIYAVNAKLHILGESFPEDSRLNLFMFVDAKDPKFSSLGWLAVFHNTTGSKIIDLKTLAAGQRIDPYSGGAVGDRPSVMELMNQIDEMGEDADDAALNDEKPKIDTVLKLLQDGKIQYKPDSAWTVGLRSTLFETFDLDFVLRDPDLYGIRVAYGKLFSIDIAYRKLTEELGVYSTEIVLPESIRSFEMGAASFTIGVIGLEIFTDGGVAVDFGYPANRNFERAFSVEVLPFTGSGGFRFARVSGAGSRMIPRPLAKNVFVYEPVTEVALGGRFGLGKSFRKGPLRASLSVTFYAYLAGAHGILRQTSNTLVPAQRPRSTYTVLAGTVGVMGEIIGFVDFGIIKAGVLVRIYVESGIVFETDRATLLYMEAGVSVHCVVVIGRIKIFGKKIEIKVSFSFSTKLRYNWEMGSTRADYAQVYDRSNVTPALTAAAVVETAASTNIEPLSWEEVALPKPEQWRADGGKDPMALVLNLVPDMTFARYADGRGEQEIHPEAVLLLTTPIRDPAKAATASGTPSVYENLIRSLVFWAIATHKDLLKNDGDTSPLDELISINDLIELERRLLGSDEQLGQPGSGRSQYRRTPLYERLTEFLKQNFQIRIGLLPDADSLPKSEGRQEQAFFPMPEDIEIKHVGFSGNAASVKLWERKFIDEDYRGLIDETFSRLVEEFSSNGVSIADAGDEAEKSSLASVIFEEHLGVLMRMGVDQLLQIMQDRYASGADGGGGTEHKRLSLRQALELLTRRTAGQDGAKEHRLPLCETALFAGRFFMHGLNLPKAGLDLDATNVPSPLVDLIEGVDEDIRGKGLPLFRLASLQQPLFAGEDPEDGKEYGFSLVRNPLADWLEVDPALDPSGVGRAAVKLDLTEYDRAAATRDQVESFAQELELDTGLKVTAHRKETLPLGNRIELAERDEGNLVVKRALWRLPNNLLTSRKPGETSGTRQGRGDLRLKLRQRLNRGPNAKIVEIPKKDEDRAGGRCWSIVVELRIQQIKSLPPIGAMPDEQEEGTPATPLKHIYQIGGVDEDMRRLLDALIMAAFPPEGTPASIDENQLDLSLYALAPQSETEGYGAYERVDIPDGDGKSGMRMVQTNLSAEPRPEIGTTSIAFAGGGDELVHANTAQPLEFIELIRRAAIVNSGGFFIHTESEAVERLFEELSPDEKPKKGERSDPFLLLIVDVDPDVVEVSEQPTVITNAVTAPMSVLNLATRMDQPDGDGDTNGELDWDGVFLETDSILHEPLYPAGVVPLRFTLPDTDVEADGNEVADMRTRFTLLDYAVVRDESEGENIWIKDGNGLGYHETLPIGATDPAEGTDGNLPRPDKLQFELSIPAARLSHVAGIEDPSPYAAVGKELQVRYRLRDIYGNSIGVEQKTDQPPIKIQYVDRLQRIADLPLLSLDWRPDASFGDSGGVVLRLRLGGSTLARVPQAGTPVVDLNQIKERVQTMASAYRLARYQLEALGTSLELQTSLNGNNSVGIGNAEKEKLADFFTKCANKLDELADNPGQPPRDDVDPTSDSRNISLEIAFELSGDTPEDGAQEDRFVEVDVSLVQRRESDLVAAHEKLDRDSDPMVEVAAPVQPRYLAETGDQDVFLTSFAMELEALVGGYHVAVGAKRVAGTGQQALWLVPKEILAVSMSEEFHENGPAFYAIPPLSTRLESFSWDQFPRYDLNPRVDGKFQMLDKDMDDLGRVLVRRVDEALSPEMVKAMLEKVPDDAPTYLRNLLSVKETVAEFYANLVTPILKGDDEDDDTRGTRGLAEKIGGTSGSPLQDRLKRRLSAAYELDTVLAFPLAFPLAFDTPKDPCGNPLLFGDMTFESAGYDLKLMSVTMINEVTNQGRSLVVVAMVGVELHIRIFDPTGEKIIDMEESELTGGDDLENLLSLLSPFPTEPNLSEEKRQKIIRHATVCAGFTPMQSFSYDTAAIQAQHPSPALISMMDAFALVPNEIYEHRLKYVITHVQRIPWPDRDGWDGFTELSSEKRYRNTAWLRLITSKSIRTSVGDKTLQGDKSTEIPVVLRDFPSHPTIRFATDGGWDGDVTKGSLQECVCAARSWDYVLGWDWDDATQDDLKITVDYNKLGPREVQSDSGSPATALKKLQAIARFVATSDMLWPDVSAFARRQGASERMTQSLDNFVAEALEMQQVLKLDKVTPVDTGLVHEQDIAEISRNSAGELEVNQNTLQAATKVEVRMATREDGTTEVYPEAEFQDIDILRFRSAWAQLDLKRNAEFGSNRWAARDAFVYRVGGIRTGDPLVPRNDIAEDILIEPASGTLLDALKDFFGILLDPNTCLADGREPSSLSFRDQVSLEVECCYLNGILDDYFSGVAPGQRQPGAEMGKLANLRADPVTCAYEVARLAQTWLEAKSVPEVKEGGWKGKLRLQVALFQEGGSAGSGVNDATISDRPFLLIRRCIVSLEGLNG
ncbi:MAG: hypothetical protein LPH21_17680 [Shewanella sp.]|nr:hypothetical protein [Shewanella sp.]